MDPQGGYLRSNVSAPEEIFSRTVADNELQFTVHFDENGRLTVSGVTGLESNCSGLIRSIGRLSFMIPWLQDLITATADLVWNSVVRKI